jgi:hypothetical protein
LGEFSQTHLASLALSPKTEAVTFLMPFRSWPSCKQWVFSYSELNCLKVNNNISSRVASAFLVQLAKWP